MTDRIYYALRHFFTGKHWYRCTYNMQAKGDETFLTQGCRFCQHVETTTKNKYVDLMRRMEDMMAAEMMRNAFKPMYVNSDPGPKMVPKIEFVGKNVLDRYIGREIAKCEKEGHTIPEGDMCRRQYARNVLQEIIETYE
jgi:hypothetical protein